MGQGVDDGFIVEYMANGGHSWSMSFGASKNDSGCGIARDSAGNVYITGRFSKTASFGGVALSSKGETDVFVASFSSAGKHLWSKGYGTTGGEAGAGIVVGPGGHLYITGYPFGSTGKSMDFGNGPVTCKTYKACGFVASLTSSGVHRWSKGIDGKGLAIASDLSGDVVIAHPASSYSSTGKLRWSTKVAANSAFAVAMDAKGNAYFTGSFVGSVNFGSGILSSRGKYDFFVVKRSPAGSLLWARRFGGTDIEEARAIAVDSVGNVYVGGMFFGKSDLGGVVLTSKGSADIFLLKLSPP